MKLSILLICISFLTIQANTSYGQGTTITTTLHNVTVEQVLDKIENTTKFKFFYQVEDVNLKQMVSLKATNEKIEVVLERLFKKTRTSFKIDEQDVYLIKRTETSSNVINNKTQQEGRIFGKIMDDRGETLVGANVKLEQTGKIVQSSVDGSFDLGGLKAGTYTIEVSYISFQTKRITDIVVKDGQPTKLDVVLVAAVNALNQVVVTGSYKKESIAGLYARQKNSASTIDGITAEQIARTPDNNVAQVLGRVSGLNVQEGKYVTVRGLSDRYNNVMLNGSQLPSTEPNKRNFAFDIIPSSMIDNVVVHKTASAHLSGEFSGGIVEVETRSIPTENFFRIKVGTGMNTKATGKDFYQPQRGKYDFLAFDDNRKFGKGFDGAEYDRLHFNPNDTPADANRSNELLQKFPNRFKMYNYGGMPVQDYDISGGRVSNFKNGNRFGIIAGLTYRNQQTATDYLDQLEKNQLFKYEGTEYDFSTNWSAMLNTGYSFGKNKIGFKNIYSRKLAEQSYLFSGEDFTGIFIDGIANTPLINSILQSRLEGEHKVGEKGPLLKWHGSLSRTEREEPDNKTHRGISYDRKNYQYIRVADALEFSNNYSSTFTEDRYTWAAEADMPFELLGRKQLVKGGYQGSYRKADFSGQMYAIIGDNGLYSGLPYYDAFAPENFKVGGLIYAPYIGNPNKAGKSNGYNGFQRLNSAYLMFDGQLLKTLRLVAGMRMEHNVTANRSVQVAYIGGNPIQKDSLVQINKVDWLPSATLIYALTPKTNIRASYFGSVARPDLRELSFFRYFDAPRSTYITGRDLKPTQIDNADLRFEYYPAPDEIISVSGFYKKFKNPIELQLRSLTGQPESTAEMFYQNLEEASNLGFEVNFRKSFGFINNGSGILNHLFLSGNFTWMDSKLKLAGKDFNWEQPDGTTLVIVADQNRPLWGQAPYLINGGLLYAGDKLGLNLSYTHVGERIIYGSQEARYNEWEKARDVLDAQVSYRFLKNNKAEVKLNFSDLLNQQVIRYFNGYTETISEPDANGIKLKTTTVNKRTYNKEEDELRRSYNYGRNMSLSFAYTF